ncbi:MAG: hypothetical protein V4590_04425 [Bacteroidota bacterium]
MHVVVFLVLLGVSATAQVQLIADSSYVSDGALMLRFKLVNTTDHTISISIDNRRSLRQLNMSHTAAELLSSIPLSFILFYHKDKFINEAPNICDNQQPQRETIRIMQGQRHTLLFQTRCLSETVLTQLNKGHTLAYKMYIRYEDMGVMKTINTEQEKLKVKKPKF